MIGNIKDIYRWLSDGDDESTEINFHYGGHSYVITALESQDSPGDYYYSVAQEGHLENEVELNMSAVNNSQALEALLVSSVIKSVLEDLEGIVNDHLKHGIECISMSLDKHTGNENSYLLFWGALQSTQSKVVHNKAEVISGQAVVVKFDGPNMSVSELIDKLQVRNDQSLKERVNSALFNSEELISDGVKQFEGKVGELIDEGYKAPGLEGGQRQGMPGAGSGGAEAGSAVDKAAKAKRGPPENAPPPPPTKKGPPQKAPPRSPQSAVRRTAYDEQAGAKETSNKKGLGPER